MLTRIFGLHGTGKTTKIYKHLEECVKNKKQAFLFVPEQYAVSAERTLISLLGNPANMYIEVINFKRLCNRVFREYGGIVSKTPDAVTKQLAMSHVLEQLSDGMREYGDIASDMDFAARMLSVTEQMHTARIFPKDIEKLLPEIDNENLKNKLYDICLAYEGYKDYMENKLDFPGDMLEKLYEVLCGYDFFKGKTVFFDSFYGYTPIEFAIIDRIIDTSDAVYATFLCENERMEDRSFDRCTSAARAFKRLADKNSVKINDVYLTEAPKYTSDALRTIASEFSLSALTNREKHTADDAIGVIGCDDIYAEAKCALRIVSRLMLEGVSPGEIAICASSVEEYCGILDDEFEKAGIPFSLDTLEDMSSYPIAALVTAAFEAASTFSMQSIIDYIKTGLSGLEDEAADRLEIYMRTWKISGRRYFCEKWHMNPDGLVEDEPDMAELDGINTSKELLLACLLPFADSLAAAVTGNDIARAVYTLTRDISRISGKSIDSLQLDMLYRVLDSINETLGDEKLSPPRFSSLFKAGVACMRSGKIPEIIDQVRFSSVALMRTDAVRYVIILGANDGIFPKECNKSGIFRNSERMTLKKLGLEFAQTDEEDSYDELFLAYCALCSARDGAYVLYRKKSLADEVMYRSVIISILEGMFGKDITRDFSENSLLDSAVSDEQLFEYYMTAPEGDEKATLEEYFRQKDNYRERIDAAAVGDFTDTPLGEGVLESLFGKNMVSSYSKLERFRECPFKYFCTYTLKLNPEPSASLGASEVGNSVHKILEELIPVLSQMNLSGKEITAEFIKENVKTRLAELLDRYMNGCSEVVTKRFEYMFSRLENSINSLCIELAAELKESSFVPVDFELKLAFDGDVPPVQIALPDGRMLSIIGAIDRVDLYKDEKTGESWIRITDYKTGSKEFKLEDTANGFNLQMLLYLYALTSKRTEKYGEVKPAGVIYRIVQPPEKTNESLGAVSSEDYCELESSGSVSGLVVADEGVLYAMEPSRGKTGRFIPYKESTKGVSGVMPYEELTVLLEDAVKKAAELAQEIALGHKSAIPVKESQRDACRFCDYKSICRYKD